MLMIWMEWFDFDYCCYGFYCLTRAFVVVVVQSSFASLGVRAFAVGGCVCAA